jgi:Flp pilus assembly protein TadD
MPQIPTNVQSRTHLERLQYLCNAERFEEALRLLIDEEQKQPATAKILSIKAMLLGKLDRYDEAVKAADESLAINESDYEVHNLKGVALYCLGRYSEAIESFDSCLMLKPNFPIAAQRRIDSLFFQGKYSKVAQAYEQSDLPDIADETWLNNLGLAYLESGDSARAYSFLARALHVNPLLSVIHANIARIHASSSNYLRYIFHRGVFSILQVLEKTSFWRKLSNKRILPHISESKVFRRSGRLFSALPQQRETKSILKLLRGLNAAWLCNDTWAWFAVNIPYEAIEKNGCKGDIDIILKRPRYLGTYDAGFTYRGFQVKVIPVDQHGHISSAKRSRSKYRGILKELNVLKKFGCEQIFFLELYVLERGYSTRNNFPSKKMEIEFIKKANFLDKLGYGYVVMAEEPAPTNEEESGGMMHMPINILLAQNNTLGSNFQKLVEGIDTFTAGPTARAMLQGLSQHDAFNVRIGYCLHCKQLTMLVPVGRESHVCGHCKRPSY